MRTYEIFDELEAYVRGKLGYGENDVRLILAKIEEVKNKYYRELNGEIDIEPRD